MSVKEINRLEVMQRLSKKQLSQAEAGTILNLSTRQIKRLLKAYRAEGARGLVSKQRGRTSNNRLSEGIKRRALDLLKTKYQGFGPTLAHEKLVEKEKLRLSKESVRKLMIEEKLWKARKAKQAVVHQLPSGAPVLVSWCKLTVRHTIGLKDAPRRVSYWCSSTMPRANCSSCGS